MADTPLRALSEAERRLVERLLDEPFAGNEELRRQLRDAKVRCIDDDGSLAFEVSASEPAQVLTRVPVEADTEDADGSLMHVLLHVVNGYLNELELYRPDGTTVKSFPSPERLNVSCNPYYLIRRPT
jgi:hypothetical protein